MSLSNSTELDDIRADATLVAKILLDECDINYDDTGVVSINTTKSISIPGVIQSTHSSTPFGTMVPEITIEITILLVPGVDLRVIEAANTIKVTDNMYLSGVQWVSTEMTTSFREPHTAHVSLVAREMNFTGPFGGTMDRDAQMIADSLSGLKVAVIDDVNKFNKLEITFSKDRYGLANIEARISDDGDLFDHLVGADRIYICCYGMNLYERCISRGRATITDGTGKAKGWKIDITLGDDIFLRKENRNNYYSLTDLSLARGMKKWWHKKEYKKELDEYVKSIHPDYKDWFLVNFLEDMSAETEAIADILKGDEVKELSMYLHAPKKPFFDIRVEESIGEPTHVTMWSENTNIADYQFAVGDYVRLDIKHPHSISGTFRCIRCAREPSRVQYSFDLVSSLELIKRQNERFINNENIVLCE